MYCATGSFLSSNVGFGLGLLNFSPSASLPVPGATPGGATQQRARPLNEWPEFFDHFIELCSSAASENKSQSLQIGADYYVDTLKGRAEAKIIAPGHVVFRIGDIGRDKAASMGIELKRDTKLGSLLAVLTYRSKEPQFSIQQATYLPVHLQKKSPLINSAKEGVGTTIITSGATFLKGVVKYSKIMGRPLLGLGDVLEKSSDEISPSIMFNLASLFPYRSPWESDFFFSRSKDDEIVGLQHDENGLIVPPKGFEENRNEEIYIASYEAVLEAYNADDPGGAVKTTKEGSRIKVLYAPHEKAPLFQFGEKFEGGDKPVIQIIQNARVYWWGAEPFANVINEMLGSAASLYGLPYHNDEGRGV